MENAHESHQPRRGDAIRAFVGVLCAGSILIEPLVILSDPTYGSASDYIEANLLYAVGVAQAVNPITRLLEHGRNRSSTE